MYCTPAETRKARKQHQCMFCAETIKEGDEYSRWMCIDDGKSKANIMHVECLEYLVDAHGSGYFEYTPYSGDRPSMNDSAAQERMEGEA